MKQEHTQHSQTTKHADILNAQLSEEENHNSEYQTGRMPLDGTPYYIIGTEEGWFLSIGRHRLTEIWNTKEELLAEWEHNKYWLIFNTICVVHNMIAQNAIQEMTVKQYADEMHKLSQDEEKIKQHEPIIKHFQ